MTPLAETVSGVDLDQLCINTIRTLSIDAVQQAKSGFPGTPWLWHRSFTRYGIGRCGSTPKIRSGPIVSVSRFRTATRQCCYCPCCT
jgi:hypothetical protein